MCMLTSVKQVFPGKTMPTGNNQTTKNCQPQHKVNIYGKISRRNRDKATGIQS